MLGSWSRSELPNLTKNNCLVTSEATPKYNCIAWAARDVVRWWWPDSMGIGYWPPGVPRHETIEAFIQAYATQGFAPSQNGDLVEGVEKIALFGLSQAGQLVPTHSALQLESGEWTSKIGPFEDIIHTRVEDVSGPVYGNVVCYLSRARTSSQLSFRLITS